ncbi:MAG: hypothetical protein ACJ74O_13545 [Frankiaceae bacterium]|jgi:hypothetical protein
MRSAIRKYVNPASSIDEVTCIGERVETDGRHWNLFSDGSRLPVMAGGAPDDDEDGKDGKDDDDADGDGDGKDDDDADGDGKDDDDADGDGKDDDGKDWKAEAAKWKRLSRQNERAARRAQAEADRLKGGKKKPAKDGKSQQRNDDDSGADDDAPDVEQIREEARQEALATAAKDRALDKVEARAAAKFEDPEVAAALLRNKVDDFVNGTEIDVEAIDDALDELLEKKPSLAKSGRKGDDGKDGKDGSGKRPRGSADGGVKDGKPARPASLHDAVAGRLSPST